MTIFLNPMYLVVTYDLMILFGVILVGMIASSQPGEAGTIGYAHLFLGLSVWAAVTGMVGPGVAQ